MYCPNCKNTVDKNDKFCSNCGHEIVCSKKTKKKSLRYILLICVEIVCIIAAVVAIKKIFLSSEKEEVALEETADNEANFLALVQNTEGKYGYINENCEEIIPCKYDDAMMFGEAGLAAVAMKAEGSSEDEEAYKWGFIDITGNLVIPMEYDMVGDFPMQQQDDVVVVGKKDEYTDTWSYGFVNIQGEEVIECAEFSDPLITMYPAHNDFKYIWLREKTIEENENVYQEAIFDKRGNVLVPFGEYESVGRNSSSNGTRAFSKVVDADNGDEVIKYGLINEKGEEITPFIYENINDWGDNDLVAASQLIEDDGKIVCKYGYINEMGYRIIPFIYDEALEFSNGLAAVKDENGTWGYINMEGEEIIKNINYTPYGGGFDKNGIAIVLDEEENIILLNTQGEKIFEGIDDILWAAEVISTYGKNIDDSYYGSDMQDIYLCMKDNKYGCVNAVGENVIPFVYSEMSPFGKNGCAAAITEDGKVQYIDRNNNVVVELDDTYQYASMFVKVQPIGE